jgi:hypothetical protein
MRCSFWDSHRYSHHTWNMSVLPWTQLASPLTLSTSHWPPESLLWSRNWCIYTFSNLNPFWWNTQPTFFISTFHKAPHFRSLTLGRYTFTDLMELESLLSHAHGSRELTLGIIKIDKYLLTQPIPLLMKLSSSLTLSMWASSTWSLEMLWMRCYLRHIGHQTSTITVCRPRYTLAPIF